MPKTKRILRSIQNTDERFWEVRAMKNETGGSAGEVFIYGPIYSEKYVKNEVAPIELKEEVEALGDIETLYVRINSPGGSAFAGIAIYNMLRRLDAEVVVTVDGLAASAASIIAMAGDKVMVGKGAMLMIHNAWTWAVGEAKDLRKTADTLDQLQKSMVSIYQEKTGLAEDKIIELLNEETWMTAEEAKELGFADSVDDSVEVAASLRDDVVVVNGREFDIAAFSKLPPEDFFSEERRRERERSAQTNPVRQALVSLAAALGFRNAAFDDVANKDEATVQHGDGSQINKEGSGPEVGDVKDKVAMAGTDHAVEPNTEQGTASANEPDFNSLDQNEIKKMFAELRERTEAAEAMARAEREQRVLNELTAEIGGYGSFPAPANELATIVHNMAENKTTAEDVEALKNFLRATGEALAQSDLFRNLGSDGDGDASALGQYRAAVKAAKEANPELSDAAASIEAFKSLPQEVQAQVQAAGIV